MNVFQNRLVSKVLIAMLLLAASAAHAKVTLPGVISENMVLQRNTAVRLWGKADPDEKVTVRFRRQKVSTTADAKGDWGVELKPLKAGGPFTMAIVGKNRIVLRNILVGEVWFCSGQSNMAMSVWGSKNARAECAKAKYPKIRLFTVPRKVADTPQTKADGAWAVCGPKSVKFFSAAAYFFGRELHKELKVPIGLINSSWGATCAQYWTPRERLQANWQLRRYITAWDNALAAYPGRIKEYKAKLAEWKKQVEKVGQKKAGRKPYEPAGPGHMSTPGGLYNGMVTPYMPFAIRGVIWYQGEGNAGLPHCIIYRTLFRTMIEGWRQGWKRADMPFLFVQLPNFRAAQKNPVEGGIAWIRESQAEALKLPNTAMAVTIDIGEANDIHPKNKQDVGYRLALAAFGTVYGKKIVYSGPIFSSAVREGSKVRIRFTHAKGLLTKGDVAVKGFALTGSDRKSVWAQAKIDGDSVLVFSDKVSDPVSVFYGWGCNPPCNLYNSAMLPAAPFRASVATPKKEK